VDVELFKTESSPLVRLKLKINGDLSDEQTTRLVQIAEACPIHKLLSGKMIIKTGLA
jgi:putative redox protein